MNKIKEAFDSVKAAESLKEKTIMYIDSAKDKRSSAFNFKRLAAACLCMILVLGIGSFTYLTPTMAITVDTNPAIKLGVNRFDRVISVSSEDEDTKAIADELKLKHKKCQNAVEEILRCPIVEELRNNGEDISFEVNCDQTEQRERARTCINECQERYGQQNGQGQGSSNGQQNGQGEGSGHQGIGQGNGYHGGKTE